MEQSKRLKIIAIIILILSAIYTNAQTPPHPNSGGGAPTTGTNTVVGGQPGGAPIGSGNILLIGLALLYATKKAVSLRRQAEA
jgi:hypothetical protein